VKVALFDTGLDPTDAVIRRQLGRITYKSFIPGEESHTAKDAKDENGHGTHCAALLLKVAKNSEVYIGRVTMGKKLESPEYISQVRPRPSPIKSLPGTNLRQAIEWAISEGVNLISMSFGFPRYTQALTDIQSSILSAYQSGIIIFAAASNGGGNSGLAYPANQNEVICIGASDGKGNKSDFTPGPYPDISNYTTLGEGVTSSWPKALSQTGQERTKIMSGTSVATPIAVGIAAMVVDFLRQLPRDVDQNLEFLVERQLRSKKGMNAVLKRLTEERDGFMYIAPWILFCDDRKEGVAQVLLDALRSC
jgi:subtilisin family serine protease